MTLNSEGNLYCAKDCLHFEYQCRFRCQYRDAVAEISNCLFSSALEPCTGHYQSLGINNV